MREVNSIVFIVELHSERKRVIVSQAFALHWVLVIADVTTCPDPAFTVLFGVDFAVHQRAHTMIVEWIRLKQVDNVKTVGSAGDRVGNSEVVPLCVSVGVVVRLQNQIIFKLVDLDCAAQVSRFKSRLKHKGVVVFKTRLVVRTHYLVVVTSIWIQRCVFICFLLIVV